MEIESGPEFNSEEQNIKDSNFVRPEIDLSNELPVDASRSETPEEKQNQPELLDNLGKIIEILESQREVEGDTAQFVAQITEHALEKFLYDPNPELVEKLVITVDQSIGKIWDKNLQERLYATRSALAEQLPYLLSLLENNTDLHPSFLGFIVTQNNRRWEKISSETTPEERENIYGDLSKIYNYIGPYVRARIEEVNTTDDIPTLKKLSNLTGRAFKYSDPLDIFVRGKIEDPDLASRVVELVRSSTTEIGEGVVNLKKEILLQPESVELVSNFEHEELGYLSPVIKFHEGLSKIVSDYNLDANSLFDTWRYNGTGLPPNASESEYYADNVRVIDKIEANRPGGATLLTDTYGIHCYSRWDKDMLIRQIDVHDRGLPYGVIIFPHYDSNGAFNQDKTRRIMSGFFDQLHRLPHPRELRIIETGGKIDLAKKLLSNDKRYGSGHLPEFVILGGHGKEELIELGMGELGVLNKNDVDQPYAERLEKMIDENATIILDSCSTGEEAGMGQTIAQRFHRTVIAPSAPGSLFSLDATETEERLNVTARFSFGLTGTGETKHYDNSGSSSRAAN